MDIKNVEGNQHFSALVTVPVAYPRHPPIFSLQCLKTGASSKKEHKAPANLSHLMSIDDFDRVDDLRNKVASEGPVLAQFFRSGEPVKPILDSIEEELHVHFGEYCQ